MSIQSQMAAVSARFNADHDYWQKIYNAADEDGYVFRMRVGLATDLCRRHMPAPGRALDLGCGCGQGTRELARLGHDALGVDIAPAMIDRARQDASRAGLSDCCRFECGDFSTLDLPAGGFDVITALGFIEYFDDPGQVLARMRDWLSDSGILILQVSNRCRLPYLLTGRHREPRQRNGSGLNCRLFSPGDIADLARNCGLRRIDYRGHSFGPLKLAGHFIPGWRASMWIDRQLDRLAAIPALRSIGRVGVSFLSVFRKCAPGA